MSTDLKLPYVFDLLFDIKTEDQLLNFTRIHLLTHENLLDCLKDYNMEYILKQAKEQIELIKKETEEK